jgi:hypothetical protein
MRTLLACAVFFFGNGLIHGQEKPKPALKGSVVSSFYDRLVDVDEVVEYDWTKEWSKLNDREIAIDESAFYDRYGSPLAYARALDLALRHGFEPRTGTKVFDFGYGSLGHLWMLASCGLDVTAVDVDPMLPLMYREYIGSIGFGSLTLLSGRFPADKSIKRSAATGYDLVLSKNTLKRGYIHPSRKLSDPRHKIELGVSDSEFLESVAAMLNPKGLFVIYNFCPQKSPPDKPYIPWAEGESPFSAEAFEKHGLEVLAFDVEDSAAARTLGKAIGWDRNSGMDVEKDLFAWYTVVRKK